MSWGQVLTIDLPPGWRPNPKHTNSWVYVGNGDVVLGGYTYADYAEQPCYAYIGELVGIRPRVGEAPRDEIGERGWHCGSMAQAREWVETQVKVRIGAGGDFNADDVLEHGAAIASKKLP